MNTGVANVVGIGQLKELSKYKVGETITLVSDGYGFYKHYDSASIRQTDQILEVQVIKVGKVNIEYEQN